MKRIIAKFFAVIMLFAISLNASAYDFEVDGIYYNIISTGDLTCEITYKELNNQTETYTGVIDIPTTVNYKNRDWTVVSIGDKAFYNCTLLSGVSLHSNIISIGNNAFYNCTMLENIILPQTLLSIGDSAFYGCTKLNYISLPPLIKVIKNSTFMNSSLIGTLLLPDSLEYIENSAFRNTKITSVSLPYKVKEIDERSFQSCMELKSINLSDSLYSIGDYAFASCISLQKLLIPKNVSIIGQRILNGCSSLEELKIDSENKIYDSRDNANAIIHSATNRLILATSATVIPNSVTKIASYSFSGVTIKELTIPASVIEIEDHAFNDCTSLQKLIISDSEDKLALGIAYDGYQERFYYVYAKGLFYDCPLKDVYIGRNLNYSSCYEYILRSTIPPFLGKSSIKSVIFGDYVTDIGCGLFEDCTNLQIVKLSKNCVIIRTCAFASTSLTEIQVPKSVTLLGGSAFSSSSLNKVYFEDGINKITIMGGGIFNQCKDLYFGREITENSLDELFPNVESVTIGDSVKQIKSNLFLNCTILKTLDLGKNLTEIGDNAFSGCDSITQITTRNRIPPTNAIFPNTVYMDANVIVPQNALEAYKSDFNWRNFWNISKGSFLSINDVEVKQSLYVDVYTLQGSLVRKGVKRDKATQGLPQGVYIIGGEKVIVK